MTFTCRGCGYELEADERFCDECGGESDPVDDGPMAEPGDDYEVSRDEGRYYGDWEG